MKEILLASPRGFCAGVNRAIDIVESVLRVYDPPLYVKHEIVHNKYVVKSLEDKGAIFVEEIDEIPKGHTVIFSAHGVPPDAWEKARKKELEVIDATCPLVTKVHLEAKRYAREGYRILLIGHIKHVETIGTLGEAPDKTIVIESTGDVEKIDFSREDKLAYLTQTTLSLLDTREIINAIEKKFPWVESPHKSDICYATTNRQNAVRKIANEVSLLLVIGSRNSSNSNRLRELGEKMGTESYLIESAEAMSKSWFRKDLKKIGLTSGASVPDILVEGTVQRLKDEFGFDRVREVKVVEEDVVFQMPKKLKERIAELV